MRSGTDAGMTPEKGRRMRTRLFVIGTVLAAMAGGPTALAMDEWWTPKGQECPVFGSQESCESFCRTDPSKCGGGTDCGFATGVERPVCSLEVD